MKESIEVTFKNTTKKNLAEDAIDCQIDCLYVSGISDVITPEEFKIMI